LFNAIRLFVVVTNDLQLAPRHRCAKTRGRGGSLTDKELLNQFKAIEKMPERDKDVIKTLIDAFITKGKLKQLVL